MPVELVVGLFIKIILMVAVGFALKKRGIIDGKTQNGLSGILTQAVLPFSVLASANSEFSAALARNLATTALISFAYYAVAIGLCLTLAHAGAQRTPLLREEKSKALFTNMSTFANTGFIGLPLVKALYGAEGLLYGIIYNMAYQLFLFTVGVMLLSGEKKVRLKSILGDLATLASIAAIAIYISPFRFPSMLCEAFAQIGDMSVPLSMMIIGCCLADIRPKQLLTEKMGFVISALRLVVFPVATLFILRWVGLSGTLVASCVLLTALPVGSLNVVLAQKYQADVKMATCTVLQSMVLFMGTLPLILVCVNFMLK